MESACTERSTDRNRGRGKDCQILKKGRSRTFTGVGLFFAIVFSNIIFHDMNESNASVVLSFFTFFALGPLVLGRIYGRWYFKIRDREVFCRSHFGKRKHCPLSELTGFEIGSRGELILYREMDRFFVISPKDKEDAICSLLENHVLSQNRNVLGKNFTMGVEPGYAGLMEVFTLIFWAGPGIPGILLYDPSLVYFGAAMSGIFGLSVLPNCLERIRVTDAHFEHTTFWGSKEILLFSQVEKVEMQYAKNTSYYCFYADGQVALKIMRLFTNIQLLNALIHEYGWMPEEAE